MTSIPALPCGRIGVGGLKKGGALNICYIKFIRRLPIHFISGYMKETFDCTKSLGCLKQYMGSINVVFCELKGVAKRVIHVSLSCEV